MSHYHHLSMNEREKILVLYTEKKSLHAISKEIGRSVSTVSREIRRSTGQGQTYSAIEAQEKYQKRRKRCKRTKLLDNTELKEIVGRLFLEHQWSPEQIANRLVYEESAFRISYPTIYRAIYAGMLDTGRLSHGNRGIIRKLRHRGKTRRRKGSIETRGKIVISNRIQQRPKEADGRQVLGHWEADTVAGKTGSACLVTITDRCSRYLLAGKVAKRYSALVAGKMIALLSALPKRKRKTITPDRGKEFAEHTLVTESLNLPFYFPDPHAPWQRGTNENTNGLLREYLPKFFDIALSSEEDIADFVEKLNHRPRKCLAWKTPFEVFFNKSLHLT
ncbi:IS30 family transposase [Caproiciproducens sp. R1]|uniref:IS30 family transposase n=1 Tax=Caproiciproducens sp. R1 TaxID=3435000 RepID=UPI0040336E46